MLRGMYTSASGMLVEGIKLDAVANNLANAQTHGFKRQTFSVRSFPEMLIHRINDPIGPMRLDPRPPVGFLGTGAAIDELALEMTPGALEFTGRDLDVAVDGPGFLGVLTPEGEVAYTRDGRLRLDAERFLVTVSGHRVIGTDGPIQIASDGPITIGDDGVVRVAGEDVGTILLWEFAEPRALERLGENLLVPMEGTGPAEIAEASTLRSGYLEKANINVVTEMVQLIALQRAYEANQRMLQTQDETVGRLINGAAGLA